MKKKYLLGLIGAVALAFGGLAVAQTIAVPLVTSMSNTDVVQVVPKGVPSAGNLYATALQLRAWILGQNTTGGTPTLTTTTSVCGGSTATILGSNYAFAVTEGSTASTSCVITFVPAFVTAPVCVAALDNVANDTAFKTATTNTAMTVTQTSSSSRVLNVICMGQVGG